MQANFTRCSCKLPSWPFTQTTICTRPISHKVSSALTHDTRGARLTGGSHLPGEAARPCMQTRNRMLFMHVEWWRIETFAHQFNNLKTFKNETTTCLVRR